MMPKQPKPNDKNALHLAWNREMLTARNARSIADTSTEWSHLERAHILSQPLPLTHVRTHAAILGYGIRGRDLREIGGQLGRMLVAGPGSLTGRYPLGNTGGANVPATEVMPIPDDLQIVLGAD
ncbi:MAG: DUF3703 domain-containing protein [Acidimicrobiales bacterium]